FFLVLNLFALSAARGQAGNGELAGEVRDPGQKIVPQARVVLTEQNTNLAYETTTNDEGIYQYSSVKPGVYNLAVEKSGFQHYERRDLTIRTGIRHRVDVALAVGTVTSSVVVKEDATLLRTESATLGQIVDANAIPVLPLNGRTFIGLIGLVPGIAVPP